MLEKRWCEIERLEPVERLNGESSGMKGRGEKGNRGGGRSRRKKRRRENGESNPRDESERKKERKLKMRKVDSEVHTVGRDLINPSNLAREEDGFPPRGKGCAIYYTLRFRITASFHRSVISN